MRGNDKKELFEVMPVPRAVASLAIPTIISQLINLIYNMVDAFFIGRTGSPYMMAATSLTLTMIMLHVAFGNLFGVGGGSLIARLMGQGKHKIAETVSAFCFYSCMILALVYSLLMGLFLNPVLRFLGASDATILYAQQYTIFVVIIGSLPAILSLTLAHLLRNTGFSAQASIGLSGGGILNMVLDPLFMFVILPKGYEVMGAAIATLLSNVASCLYLLYAFHKAGAEAPLRMGIPSARAITKGNITNILAVGIPSAILTGLFDLANICVNILASAHSDLCLAAMGIVMKVERIPNAINIGICQGMLPIVAYNFSSGNRKRMQETIRFSRIAGLMISFASILLLELLARPVTHVFLSSSAGDTDSVLIT
ncbi:MAG: cation transporter, partial [Lachnospiraceae bacterium]|nr:cation transporter [Lachnospiraceae bacterium]